MEMQDSLQSSLQQLVSLQQNQIQQLQNLSQQQSESNNIQRSKANQAQMMNGYISAPYSGYTPGYMPPAYPMNQATQASYDNFKQFSNQMDAPSKYDFWDVVYPSNRVSQSTRNQMVLDYSSRASNAALSGMSTIAQGAAMFTPLAGMGGIAAGVVGGAALGTYFDYGIQQNMQQSAFTKYLNRESYRFIDTKESRNPRDLAGFSLHQSQNAAEFLRTANSGLGISNDEMMSLTQKFTEGNLLKETKDLKDFKERMVSLTKTVKTGALLLNETFDSIADLMSELRKAGIDNKNYTNVMGTGKILGSNMGISGSEAVRNMLEMAKNLTSGTGVSAQNAMNGSAETTNAIQSYYDKLKANNNRTADQNAVYNYINNSGGPTGAASNVMSLKKGLFDTKDTGGFGSFSNAGIIFTDYNNSTGEMSFNQNKFDAFLAKGGDLRSLSRDAEIKLQELGKINPMAISKWAENSSTYLQNFLTDSQQDAYIKKITGSYQALPEMKGMAKNTEDVLRLLNIGNSEQQKMMGAYYDYQNSAEGKKERERFGIESSIETQNNYLRANNLTLFQRIDKRIEEFGEKATAWMPKLGNWAQNKIQDYADSRYGVQFSKLDIQSDNTDWSENGTLKSQIRANKGARDAKETLESLSAAGFTVDKKLLSSITGSIRTPSYTYERDTYANKSDLIKALTGVTGDKTKIAGQVIDEATKNGLSETILVALTKYKQRNPDDKSKGLGTAATVTDVAKNMQELTNKYGGNQQLAAASMMGQNVDSLLFSKLGIDINSLLKNGTQSQLQNIDLKQIITNKTVLDSIPSSGSGDSSGKNPGYSYNISGTKKGIIEAEKYSLNNDFARGRKVEGAVNPYYDITHRNAEERGISAASLDALFYAESAYHPNSISKTGYMGLGQLGKEKWDYYKESGLKYTGADGKQHKIGERSRDSEMLDPYANAAMSAHWFAKRLELSNNNQYVAYLRYNLGDTGVDNLGITNDMGYEDLRKILQGKDAKKYAWALTGLDNYHEASIADIIDKTKSTVTKSKRKKAEPATKSEMITIGSNGKIEEKAPTISNKLYSNVDDYNQMVKYMNDFETANKNKTSENKGIAIKVGEAEETARTGVMDSFAKLKGIKKSKFSSASDYRNAMLVSEMKFMDDFLKQDTSKLNVLEKTQLMDTANALIATDPTISKQYASKVKSKIPKMFTKDELNHIDEKYQKNSDGITAFMPSGEAQKKISPSDTSFSNIRFGVKPNYIEKEMSIEDKIKESTSAVREWAANGGVILKDTKSKLDNAGKTKVSALIKGINDQIKYTEKDTSADAERIALLKHEAASVFKENYKDANIQRFIKNMDQSSLDILLNGEGEDENGRKIKSSGITAKQKAWLAKNGKKLVAENSHKNLGNVAIKELQGDKADFTAVITRNHDLATVSQVLGSKLEIKDLLNTKDLTKDQSLPGYLAAEKNAKIKVSKELAEYAHNKGAEELKKQLIEALPESGVEIFKSYQQSRKKGKSQEEAFLKMTEDMLTSYTTTFKKAADRLKATETENGKSDSTTAATVDKDVNDLKTAVEKYHQSIAAVTGQQKALTTQTSNNTTEIKGITSVLIANGMYSKF